MAAIFKRLARFSPLTNMTEILRLKNCEEKLVATVVTYSHIRTHTNEHYRIFVFSKYVDIVRFGHSFKNM